MIFQKCMKGNRIFIPLYTKTKLTKFIWAFIACTFSSGDGTSDKEEKLEGEYDTAKECVDAVLEKKPDANGVTYGVLDDSRQKECYAEIGMVDTNDDSKWKSCIFGGKIIYSTIQFDGDHDHYLEIHSCCFMFIA